MGINGAVQLAIPLLLKQLRVRCKPFCLFASQRPPNSNSPGTGNTKRKGINFTERNLKIMHLKLSKLTTKLTKRVHLNRKPSQITNTIVFKTKVCMCPAFLFCTICNVLKTNESYHRELKFTCLAASATITDYLRPEFTRALRRMKLNKCMFFCFLFLRTKRILVA